MTKILNIIVYLSIIALTLLIIMMAYKVLGAIYWMRKRKFTPSNTDYEKQIITNYRKSLIVIFPVIIVISMGVFFYHIPIDFMKIAGSRESSQEIKNITIYKYGNEVGKDKAVTDRDEIVGMINILSEYNFRRNLLQSRVGRTVGSLKGQQAILISVYTKGTARPTTLEITHGGYIYDAGTGQAYKMITGNVSEAVNRIYKEIAGEK
jgi:hypothetical protein